jgi:uncharacterized membrane protein
VGRGRVVNFAAEVFVWMVLAAFVEVLATATIERLSLGDRYVLAGAPWASLQGHTTLWNIVNGVGLTAGLRVLLRFFHQRPAFRSWFMRGIVMMLLIYTCELAGGLFFNKLLGFQLWDYSQYVWRGVPLHLWGQITLVYAPLWFLAGVFVPAVYRAVHALAPYVGTQFEHLVADVEHGVDP